MELIEGKTLEDIVSQGGAFPVDEARRICAEVARALDAANRMGIIHRDIKPSNIFLETDGSVKVADWGLAKTMGSGPGRLTLMQQIACTPAYASPEQAGGKECDFRTDMYSLGCVLYEMVAECPPFRAESTMDLLFKQIHDIPLPPSTFNPDVKPDVEARGIPRQGCALHTGRSQRVPRLADLC